MNSSERAVALLREFLSELDDQTGHIGLGDLRRRLLKIIHELL